MMVLPKKHDKVRPHLWLTVAQKRASRWANGVPEFLLQHRGGAPAMSIEVDALASPVSPSLHIQFDPVKRIAEGEVRLTARLRAAGSGANGVNWAKGFFEENCAGAEAVNYSVHLRFVWDGRQDEEWLNLIWDAKTRSLRDAPASAGD